MLIKIKNLRVNCFLGIFEWEKSNEREILINLIVETDNEKSTITADITDTVDYAKLVNDIKNLAISRKFNLIEELAKEIIDIVRGYNYVISCEVEIDKMAIIAGVESCAVNLKWSIVDKN